MSYGIYNGCNILMAEIVNWDICIPGTDQIIGEISPSSEVYYTVDGEHAFLCSMDGDLVMDCNGSVIAEIQGWDVYSDGSLIGRFDGPQNMGSAAAAVLLLYSEEDLMPKYAVQNENRWCVAHVMSDTLYDTDMRCMCGMNDSPAQMNGSAIYDENRNEIGFINGDAICDLDGTILGYCKADDRDVLSLAASALFYYRDHLGLSDYVPNYRHNKEGRSVSIRDGWRDIGSAYDSKVFCVNEYIGGMDNGTVFDRWNNAVGSVSNGQIFDRNGELSGRLSCGTVYGSSDDIVFGSIDYDRFNASDDDVMLAAASLILLREELGLEPIDGPQEENDGSGTVTSELQDNTRFNIGDHEFLIVFIESKRYDEDDGFAIADVTNGIDDLKEEDVVSYVPLTTTMDEAMDLADRYISKRCAPQTVNYTAYPNTERRTGYGQHYQPPAVNQTNGKPKKKSFFKKIIGFINDI